MCYPLFEVTNMNIGEQIKKYRKEAGLSQKELGQKLGVSQQHIAQYESGKRIPKLETINKIAGALNVGVRRLYPDFSYEEWEKTDTYKKGKHRYEIIKRGVMAILSFEYPEIEEDVFEDTYFYDIVKDGQRQHISFSTISAMINYLIHIMPSLYELADRIPEEENTEKRQASHEKTDT